eukprot:TRINITY_DN17348_c0_g1_i4.p1 TRINITY_DN17348_c0_g1~~TRINITY_DN17348_c0_g1_i4.p1  ORF type:complete len:184 (+),score=46.04 TRINITY_DN17348_c0_g1_i4:67-618(+)
MRSGATGFSSLIACVDRKWQEEEKKREAARKKEEDERQQKKRKLEEEAERAKKPLPVFTPSDPQAYLDPKAYFAHWQKWQADLSIGSGQKDCMGKGRPGVSPKPVASPAALLAQKTTVAPKLGAAKSPSAATSSNLQRSSSFSLQQLTKTTKSTKSARATLAETMTGPVTGMGLLGGYDSDND